MEEIVKKLIDEVDSFEHHYDSWQDLRNDTLKELKRKPTSDNQELWVCIKAIAEYMENYVN